MSTTDDKDHFRPEAVSDIKGDRSFEQELKNGQEPDETAVLKSRLLSKLMRDTVIDDYTRNQLFENITGLPDGNVDEIKEVAEMMANRHKNDGHPR